MLTRSRAAFSAMLALVALTGCLDRSEGERLPGARAGSAAALFYANATAPGVSSFVCAGTVIDAVVVTAAHCVPPDRRVRVVFGAVDICHTEELPAIAVRTIRRPDNGLDLAVLELETPAPVLPPPPPATHGGGWSVTGWGNAGGSYRCTARTVALEAAHGCSTAPELVCLTGTAENTCNGDSGAAVVDAAGRVVAVTSSGASCTPGAPGTYVTLRGVRGWLDSVGVSLEGPSP